ncbi:MAG: Ig-like domain-containing protein [Trueperaceae bacterium]
MRTTSNLRLGALCLVLTFAACTSAPPQPPDTTPPTVASHTPDDGATNVPASDPIVVTFSEALDPATVDDQTVQLAATGSVALAKSLSLSPDGRDLVIAPVAPLQLPTTLTLHLGAGIQDLAGNPLAPQSWSWSLPAWLILGEDPVSSSVNSTFIYWSMLALDADGYPVLASNEEQAPQGRVRRWNGTEWLDLPPVVDAGGSSLITALQVDPDGRPVVTWQGHLDATYAWNVYVSRFEGGAWSLVGDGLMVNPSYYPDASDLVLDADGHPVVVWSEKSSPGNSASDLYVKRWNGVAWDQLGGKIEVNDDAAVQDVRIVLDPAGDPLVAWGERFFDASFVKLWNPTSLSWVPLGDSLSTSDTAPAPGFLSNGAPVAAIRTVDGKVLVLRYTASGWTAHTAPVIATAGRSAGRPELRTATSGELVLAWGEYGGGDSALHLATHAGGSWTFLGEPISATTPTTVLHPKLVLGPNDVPSLAYTTDRPSDVVPSAFLVENHYRRLNR